MPRNYKSAQTFFGSFKANVKITQKAKDKKNKNKKINRITKYPQN